MDILVYMIPLALLMGGLWLGIFMWALKSGQFEDPEGAANRIFQEDAEDAEDAEGHARK